MTNLKDPRLQNSVPENRSIEIAIIGAGVSGLYSAFRFTGDENTPIPAEQVQIFEMSYRIGG